jgi:CBS domain-containing protein
MESIKVKDLMVDLSEYSSVSEEATLYEAVMTLEKAHRKFDRKRYKYRVILVHDNNNRIVGLLSDLEVLSGLEPAYREIGDVRSIALSGFSAEFLKKMAANYQLWQQPLGDICGKAAQIKVKNVDYTPVEGNYITENATLNQAIHQLIVGYHQNLLVVSGEEKDIVGVLRLYDVFKQVYKMIKTCQMKAQQK